MKKGQAALEYLMTYGWAVLIIGIVAAVLYATGILNPETWGSNRTNFREMCNTTAFSHGLIMKSAILGDCELCQEFCYDDFCRLEGCEIYKLKED